MAKRSCGDGSFGERRVLFETENYLNGAHVADFSGDGVPDLILVSLQGDHVVSLIGRS